MPDAPESNEINPYAAPQATEPASSPDLALVRTASRAARLRAAIIDFGMYLLAAAAGSAVSFLAEDLNLGSLDLGEVIVPRHVLMTIAGAITLLGVIQWSLVAYEGQTVGKKVCRLRIVRIEDGGRPGFFRGVVLRSWLPLIFSAVPTFGLLFLFLDHVTIFGPDSRCLHDYFAHTKVIKLRKPKPYS